MQSFIDSSSSDNFIDKEYTSQHNFCVYSIPSVQLQLFDRSFGEEIPQAIDLDIQFPTGEVTLISFYVTKLDPSVPVVIGYSWLSCYNLLVDWARSQIIFQTPNNLARETLTSADTLSPPIDNPQLPPTPLTSQNPVSGNTQVPSVSMVNATAFLHAAKLQGSQTF
jgi:hypothetical protein